MLLNLNKFVLFILISFFLLLTACDSGNNNTGSIKKDSIYVTFLNDGTNVENASFTIAFNQNISSTSLKSGIALQRFIDSVDVAPELIPVSVQYNQSNNSAVIKSSSKLIIGERYRLKIKTSLSNSDNTAELKATAIHTFQVSQTAWTNFTILGEHNRVIVKNIPHAFNNGLNNELTAVMEDNKKLYQSFYDSVNQSWSARSLLTSIINSNTSFEKIKTNIDLNGNAITSWLTEEIRGPRSKIVSIWVNNYISGQWSTEHKVASFEMSFKMPYNYDLSVAKNGDAYIVWNVPGQATNSGRGGSELYFSHYSNGGNWSTAKLIEKAASSIHRVKVVLDSNANGIIVWSGKINNNSKATGRPLNANKIQAGTVFVAQQIVANFAIAYDFQLANNDNSEVMLVWIENVINSTNNDVTYLLNSIQYKNGAWSPTKQHDTTLTHFINVPRLTMNDLGQVLLSWKIKPRLAQVPITPTPVSHYKAKYFDGTTWGSSKDFGQFTSFQSEYITATKKFELYLVSSVLGNTSFDNKYFTYEYSPNVNTWTTKPHLNASYKIDSLNIPVRLYIVRKRISDSQVLRTRGVDFTEHYVSAQYK